MRLASDGDVNCHTVRLTKCVVDRRAIRLIDTVRLTDIPRLHCEIENIVRFMDKMRLKNVHGSGEYAVRLNDSEVDRQRG